MKTFFSTLFGFLVGAIFASFVLIGQDTEVIETKETETVYTETIISENESLLINAIDLVYDGVVLVENEASDGYLNSTGTGFFYKQVDDGYLLVTNNHVVDGASRINLVFSDGTSIEDVELIGSDELSDLAVIKVNDSGEYTVLEIGESGALQVGQTVFAIGSPLGEEYINSVSKGIVSGLNRIVNDEDLILSVIQTDTAINPGNSGGPLLTLEGKVIGINSLKLVQSEVEGMGFALPIDEAIVFLESIESDGEVIRPTFGIRTIDVEYLSNAYRNEYGVPETLETGVLVIEVIGGTAADLGGIEIGDIIIEFEGSTVNDIYDFRKNLYKHKSGDSVSVKVVRNGQYKDVTVSLDNTPLE